MLSIIIPSCNEMFLQPTINSLIERAEGDIEIIAVIDGDWPKVSIKDDPHVILIHHVKRGMRNAINEAVRIAKGKYIMKCDGHCLFDKGFDVKLAADCEPDWLSVPSRYSLDPEKWEKRPEKKAINYMYIIPPIEKTKDDGRFWETGFCGVTWKDKENDKPIDDLMTFQGSCWFMHRDFFFKIDCMDEEIAGTFTKEAQELGCKVWLLGGRVIRNKKTWYAHLHKGKQYGRGYFLSRKEMQRGNEAVVDYWMNNRWPKQTRKLKWLIDHFAPVPGWEDYGMDVLEYILKKFNLKGDEKSPIQLREYYRQDFDKLLGDLELNEGCEVGVKEGWHAESLLDANPNLHLHVVDCYYFYKEMPRSSHKLKMEDYLAQMRARLAGLNFTEHIMFSMEAINELEDESLDFVYIDGNHQFDFVIRDIIEWNKKVRIGGIVAGHDYKSQKNIGVNQAVNAYIEAHNICPVFVTSRKGAYPDNTRSFFWVKQ